MAVFNETSHSAFGQGLSETISRAAFRAVTSFIEWNDNRKTSKVLGRLSDRELDDIGLTRGSIPFIR